MRIYLGITIYVLHLCACNGKLETQKPNSCTVISIFDNNLDQQTKAPDTIESSADSENTSIFILYILQNLLCSNDSDQTTNEEDVQRFKFYKTVGNTNRYKTGFSL